MSTRSTKANVSKLLSSAARAAGVNKNDVFTVIKPCQEKLYETMKAKCCDIYNVVVGPYANNSWTVYFGFKTSEHFIQFDIESLFADREKWIEQMTSIALARCEATLESLKAPETNPVDDAMSDDFDTVKARIRRLKRAGGRDTDVNNEEMKLRQMRRSSFDLDDVIKDGASKENLAPFTHLFPKTCQVALAQVVQ
tara:strand:+ start:2558 stop:3145 length:588 start_codon:yes stop_codon:yes gene_type:complete